MSASTKSLRVAEIFHSIQGESSHAGRPCVFVRLTGCSLRCEYCDTTYAYTGGTDIDIEDIVSRVRQFGTPLVEITGGEPLEQAESADLARRLLAEGYAVMLETGGHVSIAAVPHAVVKILDVKCPDSGEGGTFRMENLPLAAPHDEFKFVIASRQDYEWSRDFYHEHLETLPNVVLFSPVHLQLPARDLAAWILHDQLPVRLQLQMHKYVWGPRARGV